MRWVPLAEVPQLIADRDVLGAGTIVALLQLVALAHGVDVQAVFLMTASMRLS